MLQVVVVVVTVNSSQLKGIICKDNTFQTYQTYFETIKCDNEEVFHLEYHNKRITKTVGLNIYLQDYIYPPSSQLLKCKVIYDKSGIIDIFYTPYTPKDIKTFKLVYDDDITYKYKQSNRKDIESLVKKKDDADEIIIVKNDLITDTSIANIAIFDGQHWLTPKAPLLEGTTRHRLIDEDKLVETNISVDKLIQAKKIALMNAMIDFKIIDDFHLLY
jgi:4-amino-4-deoxychorismate lyase